MHIRPPAVFLWFYLRACGAHTPDFWTLPTECKCRTMVEWSQFITFASSRVHWRGSLWFNVFKPSSSNPESLPELGESLMSKRSSLKGENHFLAVLSPMALSPYMVKCFWPPPSLLSLYWTQREEYVGNVPTSPHDTPFLASTAPLTIFKWQNFTV